MSIYIQCLKLDFFYVGDELFKGNRSHGGGHKSRGPKSKGERRGNEEITVRRKERGVSENLNRGPEAQSTVESLGSGIVQGIFKNVVGEMTRGVKVR